MEFNLDMPNFGEEKFVVLDLAAIWNLRIGDAIIAPWSFEPGKTWLFSMLATPNEGFEDQVDANSHVLQYLGMRYVQRRTLLFERHIRLLLPKTRQDLSLMLIGIHALFMHVGLQPATLFN